MNSMDPLHPPHDPVPLHPVETEVVAQWPPGTFLENLALDSDGESWLVTSPFNQTIYRVRADGATQIAAKFDQWVTGIVSHPQGPLRRSRDFARRRWPFGQHKMTVCLVGANRRPDPLRQARRWLRPMVSRGDEASASATTVAAQSVPRDANAPCPGGRGSALVTRCLSSLAT